MLKTIIALGALATFAVAPAYAEGLPGNNGTQLNGLELNGGGVNGDGTNGGSVNGGGENGGGTNGVTAESSTLSINAFQLPPEKR